MNLIVLPWLMQQFYIHNQRSMDEKRLRDLIYPLMRKIGSRVWQEKNAELNPIY